MSEKELKDLFNLDVETLEVLKKYYDFVIEKNKVLNLTSIIEKDEFYLKHFCDSLYLNKTIDFSKSLYICDFGTGAGFPGLVLKIVYPNLKVDLIEATNKKCGFLKGVVESLKLKDVNIICDRIEEYSKKNIEKYDYVLCRAVAKLGILCEISSQVIKNGGYLVCMKSSYKEEIKNVEKVKTLGLELENIIDFDLKGNKRCLIKFIKKENTNHIYPRNYNLIKKNPLF